jgi:hypothetical protein
MRRKHQVDCPPVNGLVAYVFVLVLIPLANRVVAADVPFVIETSRLVQVNSVEGLPSDVKKILGRQMSGIQGFADKWGGFNKTDVVDERLPMRRFITGGAGPSSALVAYEQGGRGYSIHAVAFALEKSGGWIKVGEWALQENPYSLRGLLELVDSRHYGYRLKSQPFRREGPLREVNLSDQEVREIQAATLEVLPGSLLNISGVVRGCPCEEGLECSDQVWVVAHRTGHTQGLELSRINERWQIGVVQQWWLNYEKIRNIPTPEAYRKALQKLDASFPICANKPAASIQEAASRSRS